MHTRIFLKTNFSFNAAIADVHKIWVPAYLLPITDRIFQQYIAICNKSTSVSLIDAHLQRTRSEIVYVQTQSCDQISNHARIDSFFFRNGVKSSAAPLFYLSGI